MENFLYFATATAPDATESTEEVVMFPVSRLSHFEMQSATRMKIFFTEDAGQIVETTDNTARTVVALDITSGAHKQVLKAIASAASDPVGNNGFVVIADSANSVFLHTDITLCAGIDVIDA